MFVRMFSLEKIQIQQKEQKSLGAARQQICTYLRLFSSSALDKTADIDQPTYKAASVSTNKSLLQSASTIVTILLLKWAWYIEYTFIVLQIIIQEYSRIF